MKSIGVIPARWQSSRFPGKPLIDILGKSLLRRTYENAIQSKKLDAVVIATDDIRIYDHSKSFGAKTFMTSISCPTGTDRVWEVINTHFKEASIIVNIQGDEPCLNPAVIDCLIERLAQTREAFVTTPVAKITDENFINKRDVVKCVFDKEGRALYFSRSPIPFVRAGCPRPIFYRHLGIYCFKHEALQKYVALERSPLQESEDLEHLKMLEHGLPIHVCVVDEEAIGVDTPEDVKIVENLLCQKENICL